MCPRGSGYGRGSLHRPGGGSPVAGLQGHPGTQPRGAGGSEGSAEHPERPIGNAPFPGGCLNAAVILIIQESYEVFNILS